MYLQYHWNNCNPLLLQNKNDSLVKYFKHQESSSIFQDHKVRANKDCYGFQLNELSYDKHTW